MTSIDAQIQMPCGIFDIAKEDGLQKRNKGRRGIPIGQSAWWMNFSLSLWQGHFCWRKKNPIGNKMRMCIRMTTRGSKAKTRGQDQRPKPEAKTRGRDLESISQSTKTLLKMSCQYYLSVLCCDITLCLAMGDPWDNNRHPNHRSPSIAFGTENRRKGKASRMPITISNVSQ